MVHLVCDCLNIRIHAKGVSTSPADPSSLNLTTEQLSLPFFQHGIAGVALDLGGITKEVPCLVKSQQIGDWTIYSCLNCKLDCYSVHAIQGIDVVLVSQKMKSDLTLINGLMQSEAYSPLYKIILHHKAESPGRNSLNLDLHIQRSEAMEMALRALQQQLTKYLQAEQEAMEDRIRLLIEKQKNAFSQLQTRVRQDKQAISSILLESEEHELQNSLSEAMIDNTGLTPPMTPVSNANQSSADSPLTTSDDFREQLTSEENDQVVSDIPRSKPIHPRPQSFSRPLHGKVSGRRRGVVKAPRVAQSLDSDGIFDFDGGEDEVTPFYHSDDDDVDLLSDGNSDDVFTPAMKDPHHQYPMSLPITMPVFRDPFDWNEEPDDSKEPLPEDPDQIAASIQALAQSVCLSDGTAMFGDLPRPRLNTLH